MNAHSSRMPRAWLPPALLVALMVLFASPSVGLAEQQVASSPAAMPAIAELQLGFAGMCKLGHWAPLRVGVEGRASGDALLTVEAPDSDSVSTTVPAATAAAAAPALTELVVRIGQKNADLRAELRAGSQLLATRSLALDSASQKTLALTLPATSNFIVCVDGPDWLTEALVDKTLSVDVATHVAQLPTAAGLPTAAQAYEGVDTLILWGTDPAAWATDLLTPERRQALDRWVKLGGSLLLVIGEQAPQLLPDDQPLASLLPGRFEQMQPLRLPRAIETFGSGRFPVRAAGGLDLRVPRLVEVRGQILAYEGNQPGDLPLVIRAPHGLGEVTFCAIDFLRPPLSEWSGRDDFLRRLVGTVASESLAPAVETAGLTSLGYTDLVGQLRRRLDRFAGVRNVGFAEVALLGLLFIALAGPLDYLLVHKLLRRPVLTWVSLPLVMIATSVAAYALAHYSKGDQFRYNQVEIVDVDVASGQCRGTVWAGVFAPRSCRLDLSFTPAAAGPVAQNLAPTHWLAWLGLPGDALGGMQSGEDSALAARGYRYSPDLTRLAGMPLPVWSTKTLTARWWADFNGQLSGQLSESYGAGPLSGSIENRLGVTLVDCRLYYGSAAYSLGELASGSGIDLGDVPHRSLRNLLIRRNALDESAVPNYDPAGEELDFLLDMMMWYDKAGGPSFVRLLHRYQSFIDLSRHLELGRAVLVARGAGSAGQPVSRIVDESGHLQAAPGEQTLIYRFVLPVSSAN